MVIVSTTDKTKVSCLARTPQYLCKQSKHYVATATEDKPRHQFRNSRIVVSFRTCPDWYSLIVTYDCVQLSQAGFHSHLPPHPEEPVEIPQRRQSARYTDGSNTADVVWTGEGWLGRHTGAMSWKALQLHCAGDLSRYRNLHSDTRKTINLCDPVRMTH